MENDKTLESLKKLRNAIDGIITVLEATDPPDSEVEQAMGRFIITLMELDALK